MLTRLFDPRFPSAVLTSFTVAATSFNFAVSTPDRDLMDDAMLLIPLPAFLRSSPTPEKPRITSRICFNFSVSNPSVIFFIEVRAFVTLSIPPSALSVVASISNKMLSTLLSGILPPHFVKPCPWVVLFVRKIRKHGELRRTCAVSVRQPIPM